MATRIAVPSSATFIQYAGYGVWNSTCDCTFKVQMAYGGGTRVFLAGSQWCDVDPAPGERKYLYIFWKTPKGGIASGVVGEDDSTGIKVP